MRQLQKCGRKKFTARIDRLLDAGICLVTTRTRVEGVRRWTYTTQTNLDIGYYSIADGNDEKTYFIRGEGDVNELIHTYAKRQDAPQP